MNSATNITKIPARNLAVGMWVVTNCGKLRKVGFVEMRADSVLVCWTVRGGRTYPIDGEVSIRA